MLHGYRIPYLFFLLINLYRYEMHVVLIKCCIYRLFFWYIAQIGIVNTLWGFFITQDPSMFSSKWTLIHDLVPAAATTDKHRLCDCISLTYFKGWPKLVKQVETIPWSFPEPEHRDRAWVGYWLLSIIESGWKAEAPEIESRLNMRLKG